MFDRAVEESRQRQLAVLASEHLFYAFAQVEWDLFAQAMRYAEVNPHEVLRSVDEQPRSVSSAARCAVNEAGKTIEIDEDALEVIAMDGYSTIRAAGREIVVEADSDHSTGHDRSFAFLEVA